MEDSRMSKQLLNSIVIVGGLVTGFVPAALVLAQDDQEERLNGLFVPDEDQLTREERRAEFAKNNPEAAARMEQRRAEMEQRQAEFAAKYPEAAAEMQSWREQGKTEREQQRAEMESRRAEFETKYPEAAAEMRSMREAGKLEGEQRRAEMEARRKQFAEKYPDAAAEMRSWRRQGMEGRPRGGDFGRPGMNRRQEGFRQRQ